MIPFEVVLSAADVDQERNVDPAGVGRAHPAVRSRVYGTTSGSMSTTDTEIEWRSLPVDARIKLRRLYAD